MKNHPECNLGYSIELPGRKPHLNANYILDKIFFYNISTQISRAFVTEYKEKGKVIFGDILITKEKVDQYLKAKVKPQVSIEFKSFVEHLQLTKGFLETAIQHLSELITPETVKCKDYLGDTILYKAANQGHVGIVEKIVKLGGDVNSQNNVGDTVLHKLFRFYSNDNERMLKDNIIKTIQFLIKSGANLELKNKGGESVSDYFDKFSDTCKVLLNPTANQNSNQKPIIDAPEEEGIYSNNYKPVIKSIKDLQNNPADDLDDVVEIGAESPGNNE